MDRHTDPDVRLLRGVADPNRLAILRRLRREGSVAACDFRCCNVGQPTVSHHLKVLRDAGWVRTERRASRVYYSLEPGAVERLLAIAGELMPAPAVPRRRRVEIRPGAGSDLPYGRKVARGWSDSAVAHTGGVLVGETGRYANRASGSIQRSLAVARRSRRG
jgi:ArsR family transcriptional regulator, arsenate/arsenite/antimonite-responsive transcriptional repressor